MNRSRSWRSIIADYGIYIGFFGLIVTLSLITDRFLTVRNLLNVAEQASLISIVGIGMTAVILMGEIDLSVGSLVALSGVVTAGSLTGGLGLPLSIVIGLGAGVALGLVNGIITVYGEIPSFIVTLGMLSVAKGLTLLYTGGEPIWGFGDTFKFIGGGKIFGVPVPVIIAACLYIIALIVLNMTQVGRHIYAIGGNQRAVRLSGVKVERLKTAVFGISGFFAAASGIVLASRLASAQPTAGSGWELDAIAAVVLGGTSLYGGEGGMAGTLVGALIFSVINNGMILTGIPTFFQYVVKGGIIILALLLDKKLRQS
ncbi:MAG: ABC transporter permease [Candidatus Bipolaricaulota bacterium]|nr:ABC transporter permease [Candidatus Bipolaricaulota bacterium]MBS3791667.1 ABC transporter permease [Candidatus Bipolaricaulota bacterium]